MEDQQQALDYFEKFNVIEKEINQAYPDNVFYKEALATSYLKLGSTYSSLDNLDKALENFQQSQPISKNLYESSPENVEYKLQWINLNKEMGIFYLEKKNDKTKALEHLQLAEKRCKELTVESPKNVEYPKTLKEIQETLKKLE